MARAYRVPQKMMKIYRFDKGNSNVIEILPDNNDNDFKEGDPILLEDHACNFLSQYYLISSHYFKNAVVVKRLSDCPKDYITVEFINVILSRPTSVGKSSIKKLIK